MIPFRRKDTSGPLVLVLEGNLTADVLKKALRDADARLSKGPRALIVDCTTMAAYERDARDFFVEWNRAHKARLTHVAIVTIRPLWRLVISAMSMASTQEMRAFDDLASARRWIDEGDGGDSDADSFIDG